MTRLQQKESIANDLRTWMRIRCRGTSRAVRAAALTTILVENNLPTPRKP